MNILGFGGSGHDWSSCLLSKDGSIINIEEERLNRCKYGLGANLLNSLSRESVIRAKGLTYKDIELAVACDLVPLTMVFPLREKVYRIRHHEAHAYSAFYSSPFNKAAMLIVDNSGSPLGSNILDRAENRTVETVTFWQGDKKGIRLVHEITGNQRLKVNKPSDFYANPGLTDNSLGQLYSICSEIIGFLHVGSSGQKISEDGKTMGLASYGDMRYYVELRDYLKLEKEGQFKLNISDGQFQMHLESLIQRCVSKKDNFFHVHAAIAKAIQCMLEDALIHLTVHLKKLTRSSFLAMAGGVALNCVANAKILEKSGFKDIYIMPASGDSGTALGAALYGRIKIANLSPLPNLYKNLPFLGIKYSNVAIIEALKILEDQACTRVEYKDPFVKIAELIAQQQIIGWFEGRSELGPRALGHRSIFADPRCFEIREKINRKIKNREPFRPFAGCFLDSELKDYIDVKYSSVLPFMLMIGKIKKNKLSQLQAIAHIDETTRIQSVGRDRYPSLYKLILAFKEITGISCLLNTSFNLSGEPLVESPQDAVNCFLRSDLDYLFIEGNLYGNRPKQNNLSTGTIPA